MAVIEEPTALADLTALDVSVVDAHIVAPKIVDGRIVDGRIVSGRVVGSGDLDRRTRRARHVESQQRHTEIVAVVGLALALLLAYVL